MAGSGSGAAGGPARGPHSRRDLRLCIRYLLVWLDLARLDLILRGFYDARHVSNASTFMYPLRIACATIAIMASAMSCIPQQSAEHRSFPRTVPEPPTVEGSVVRHAPGTRAYPTRSTAPIREPGAGTPAPGGAFPAPGASLARGDTWEHVRLLMTVVPVRSELSSLHEFRRKLRRYHGNQRFFDIIGDNARPWLYHITRELAARGIPGEIALLPAVESGYDGRAVSPRNAAGLWQLLAGTAREFKLSPRSWWYDARHDTPAATGAALDYLTTLRDLFNNDWLLAVAAYNCGPGNVRRAIRRAGLEIETADYAAIERHLPAETRGHIAKWLVLSEIVAMPRLHNVRIEAIPWRPYFTTVSANSQIDLADAARHVGMSPREFSALNFGYRRGVTAPNGPHRVLVPVERAERLDRELSRAGPVRLAPVRLAEGPRYRIRQGDTLGLIARAHGTTVEALMAANRLDSDLIRAGRELLIPVLGSLSGTLASANPGVHVVSPGDTLWLIARKYQATVSSLRDWNRLAPGSNVLRPGQHLRVRGEG